MKRVLAPVIAGFLLAGFCLTALAQTATAPVPAASQNLAPDPLADYSKASPVCRTALQRALALKEAGKWRSAFDALAAYDPSNADPYALAMKTRLCIDGFVQTEAYQSFTLVDLDQGQTLEDARAKGSDAPALSFDPPVLAATLALKGTAAPPVLSKVLGDYYYSAQIEYAGQWIMSDDEAYAKALEQYQAAYAGGVFDGDSLQNLAELLMRAGRSAEAAPIFQKSIALNPTSATARYNYAVCLIQQGDRSGAFVQLDRAVELFTDPQPKFDTLSLAAHTAADAGDAVRTEAYLKQAEALASDGPNALVLRHEIAVTHKNPAAADAAADALMLKFAANPGVVRALVSAWYTNGDAPSARAFLTRSIAGGKDDKSIGTLDFYLAILLAQGNPSDADKTAALAALDQAVAHMQKIMAPTDDFFTVVQQVRDQIAPPAAGQGQAPVPGAVAPPTAP